MNVIMFALGAVALVGSGWILNRLRPRDGREQPKWVQTDLGSNTVGLGIIVLGLAGIGLMVKSITG